MTYQVESSRRGTNPDHAASMWRLAYGDRAAAIVPERYARSPGSWQRRASGRHAVASGRQWLCQSALNSFQVTASKSFHLASSALLRLDPLMLNGTGPATKSAIRNRTTRPVVRRCALAAKAASPNRHRPLMPHLSTAWHCVERPSRTLRAVKNGGLAAILDRHSPQRCGVGWSGRRDGSSVEQRDGRLVSRTKVGRLR
jgi:hypothetical protein